ncbi:uncharacterized protein ACJ7VT_020708 isoform 1-T1 [Polymixia lowei]
MNYLSANSLVALQLYTKDEAVFVENAVKSAISAIMDVIYSVNNGKMTEYQRMVAQRDKEINRLEYKLVKAENELRALRLQRGPCGSTPEKDSIYVNPDTSDASFERLCGESDSESEQHVKMEWPSLDAITSPSVSAQCQGGVSYVASSDHEEQISHSLERTMDLVSPVGEVTSAVVKEEPFAAETVFIKWEMCEERLRGHQGGKQRGCCRRQNPNKNSRGLTGAEKQRLYRERCRACPERLRAYKERERQSYLKKRVLISEMSEDKKRQKRAAWRAAARRHRDRKVVQNAFTKPCNPDQLTPSKWCPLPHNTEQPKDSRTHPRGRSGSNRAEGQLQS